jgi:hypothetical protein
MSTIQKISFTLYFIICSFLVSAQEQLSRPVYHEMYLSSGGVGYQAPALLTSDLKSLAPQSQILNRDLSLFNRQIGFGYNSLPSSINNNTYAPFNSSFAGGVIFEAALGTYAFSKNEKRNIQMRFGIGYGSTASLGTFWSREQVTPYDTFIAGNGSQITADSVNYESINATYSSNQLRVNADILYHTNPDRRFSLFFGAGIVMGATFNNQTQIFYINQSFITTEYENTTTVFSQSTQETKSELYNNGSGWLAGGYIPIGLSYRLGKTTPLLNQTAVFVEFRPGLTAINVPEIATYILPTFHSNLGIRIRF